MNFFYNIFLNLILVLFPYLIYFLVKIYLPKKEKILFIILSYLSLLLLLLYGEISLIEGAIYLFIPVLFNYIYKNIKTSIVISFIVIIMYNYFFNINIYILIIEYLLYLIIYKIYQKKEKDLSLYINNFIIIKSFFYSFYIFKIHLNNGLNLNLIYITISIFMAYFISYSFYYFNNNHISINELESLKKKIDNQDNLKNYLCAVTHELKNSLCITKGYLDIMKTKNKEEYIRIIRKEINRSINMIQDGLNLSKDKMNYEILDVNLLLEDVTDTLEELFKKNKIKYRVNYLEDDVYILGDYEKLKQVFINLLKNCVEAKDKNLKIDISTYLSKNNVCILVKDNGVGIDDINKISKNYSSKLNGIGIGTILSKNIIEKHQGKLIYESVKNEGTTVNILLPIFK